MDRISYLPDPIRSHIVSFLPFKDAIRTSILSQQWRHVCSSLSNLDFRQIEHIKYDGREGVERFKSIIDRTLILHDGLDIQKFCLKIRLAEDDPIFLLHINAWIIFALRHNVKKLDLDIVNLDEDLVQLQLPCALFTCPTLVSFTFYVVDLKFPAVIRFPVLKKLKLYEITFPNEYLTDKLFSDCCCPMLNDLLIKYCYLQNLTELNISLSCL
ncbi:F-box protein [Thalictrum thalictroides]|uniref:F-box protein n=1 Tax=Thalictrum thalictroides TaxID=46969 RepID=A0A7J6VST2_THATH|nr:F-box protein [Thalictrum thalictroides]